MTSSRHHPKLVRMKPYFLILATLMMMGCAAALVTESNDPQTKIDQATLLFNEQGRPLAAIKLLEQAILLAQKQSRKLLEADAEFYLGEIYKNPGPSDQRIADSKKAIEHYQRSIALYDELKFFKRSAFTHWNSSAAYALSGNKKAQCEALRSAEKSHERLGGAAGDLLTLELSDGKLLASIRSLLTQNKCR